MKEDKTLKYISGSRRLTEKDISFSDEIMFNDEDGSLNFYMDACFDVDAVFGTHVCTDENDDFLNIYANYDIRSDKVCKDLVVILDRADGTNEPMAYELTDAECDMLRRKMEAYCKMPLADYVEKFAETPASIYVVSCRAAGGLCDPKVFSSDLDAHNYVYGQLAEMVRRYCDESGLTCPEVPDDELVAWADDQDITLGLAFVAYDDWTEFAVAEVALPDGFCAGRGA